MRAAPLTLTAFFVTVAFMACRDFLTPHPPARIVTQSSPSPEGRGGQGVRIDGRGRQGVRTETRRDQEASPEIETIERIDGLMVAIQRNPRDVSRIRALADLHVRMGWDEQAVPALARALELNPGSVEVRRDLDAAIARVGWEPADLAELARQFVDLLEMWGHGC